MIINELNTASFKGVIFYITDSNIEGGRKTTNHEYPNTNRRYVEDLGKKGKTFRVDGFTKGEASEYFTNRDALINALDEENTGILIHPFYGTLTVKSTTYTIRESVADLGRADFSIDFEHTDDVIYPFEAEGASKEKVEENIQDIKDLIEDDITQNIVVNSPGAFQDLVAQKVKIQDKFNSVIQSAINKTQSVNLFAIEITGFTTNVSIGDIVKFAKATNGLFTSFKSSIADARSRFYYATSFFDFGDSDPPIMPVTKEKIAQQQNRDVINSAIQVNSTLAAYDALYNINYKTVDEVQQIKEIISQQYEKLATSEIVVQEVKNTLQDIHNETNTFFEETILNTSRVIEVETNRIPLNVLAYNYYENLDKVEEIININKIKSPAFVEGTIKVLTNE